jgi:hypothetical protein
LKTIRCLCQRSARGDGWYMEEGLEPTPECRRRVYQDEDAATVAVLIGERRDFVGYYVCVERWRDGDDCVAVAV